MGRRFFRIKARLVSGVRTVLAEKLGTGFYRIVTNEGEWGGKGVEQRLLLNESDLISEVPAEIDKKYGTLKVRA